MVEVFVPPSPSLGRDPVTVSSTADIHALLSAFVTDAKGESAHGEVIMVAVGHDRRLHAVVAFGEVELEDMVHDPVPLVSIAVGTGCRSVMLGQMGVHSADLIEAQRVLGAALAVDDVELEEWIDLDGELFRACE